jgi:hypothetical protein
LSLSVNRYQVILKEEFILFFILFFIQVQPLFCDWIKANIKDWQECVVVAPDEGSVKRCTSVANDLNLDFALITNRKSKGQIISEQKYGVLNFTKMLLLGFLPKPLKRVKSRK